MNRSKDTYNALGADAHVEHADEATRPTFGAVVIATAELPAFPAGASVVEVRRHDVSISVVNNGRGPVALAPASRHDSVEDAAGASIRALADALWVLQRAFDEACRVALGDGEES